jgi:hypothetical protein
MANLVREMRDESWRQGLLRIDGPQEVLADGWKLISPPAEAWPPSIQEEAENGEIAVTS